MATADMGRTIFAKDLNAPYGLALANGQIYVANQDSLVRFAYSDGQTQAIGPPVHVTDLPSEINHHWTKALPANPAGGVPSVRHGSTTTSPERGMCQQTAPAGYWVLKAHTSDP